MKQGPVEKGQNGSGLSGIRPNWLRTNWEDPSYTHMVQDLSSPIHSMQPDVRFCTYSQTNPHPLVNSRSKIKLFYTHELKHFLTKLHPDGMMGL